MNRRQKKKKRKKRKAHISTEAFLKILNEKYMWFTEAELLEMIDEELNKDPNVMDTDLIDRCLDALDGKFDALYDDDESKATDNS